MEEKLPNEFGRRASQSGTSLLETLIALTILIIVSVGIMGLGVVALATTENQGHLAARTAEYAQDKMEQLMSLSYGDPTTDSTTFPSPSTGGTGLTVGGSFDPSSPVASPGTGYVDYLDISGQPVSSTGNWAYIRVWKISAFSATVKQITVSTKVKAQVGALAGALPQSTLTSLKTSPF
jgi:type II secretory pathway pseudopilin PulG